MNRFRKLIPALVIVSLGAVVLLARPGSTAAPKPSASLPVGYVDMEEVAGRSPAGQEAQKQAAALKSKLEGELESKRQVRLLTSEQRTELEKLQAKSSQSDQDKARIAELRGITAKMDTELRELQQKTSLTEADKARIQELIKLDQQMSAQLLSERDAAQKQLEEKGLQLMESLQSKIMKAVEDTARDRGLAMVVHKEARLFGGIDITDDVVGRLRK